jgi:hypothetical protein
MPPPIGVRLNAENRPLPSEVLCHSRSHLERGLGQTDRLAALDRPVERARTDIWWVDRDGGNADEVAVDIAPVFEEQALDWFATHSDLPTTLAEIEDGHDCFIKFDMAALLPVKSATSRSSGRMLIAPRRRPLESATNLTLMALQDLT